MSVPTPILQYNLSDATMKGLLPDGYTPLAYIECNGSQLINTGVGINNNIKISAKWGNLSWTSGGYNLLYGANSGSSNTLTAWCASGYNWRWGGLAPSVKPVWNLADINYTEQSKDGIRINGTLVSTYSGTPSFNNQTIYLFGDTGTSYYLTGRCYYLNILNNNNLVADLRPARRDSDGVIGMYDLVSRTFKTNSGSGAFVAGPELAVGKGGGKSLPKEYQQVEYLESTGTQYININYPYDSTNTTYKVNCMFQMTTVNSPYQAVYGAYTSEQHNSFRLLRFNNDSSLLITTNGKAGGNNNSQNVGSIFNVFTINHTYDSYTINNLTTNSSWTNNSPAHGGGSDTNSQFYLFSQTPTGCLASERIHYFKLYTGTTLVRNFIPCYRKLDGKPGMYDTVNGVFYTNAGSGEFILGPSITNCYTSEPNAGSGTQQGLYTNLSGIYDSSKGWVAEFNGNTSKLISQGNSSFVLPLSISCWINFAAMNSTYQYAISYNRNDGGRSDHLFGIGAHSSKLAFWSCGAAAQINDSISTNTWYHVTLTINSSKQATFYLNGVQKYQGTPGDSSITATDFWIGCRCAGQHWFNGMLSNVQVWDSVLTEAQVKELYGK